MSAIVADSHKAKMTKRKDSLTKSEIAEVVATIGTPIVSPAQLSEILGISVKTIYEWISKDRFDGAFRKRGKHIFFSLKRALAAVFNDPEWN